VKPLSLKFFNILTVILGLGVFSYSAINADELDQYLVGEIAHLNEVEGDVNIHDVLLVSAFDKTEKTVEALATKKGKVLLVTFWSKYCLQCRRHLKQLAAAQSLLGIDRLEVVAINLDKGPFSRVRKMLDQRGLMSLAAYQDFNKNVPFRLKVDPDLHFFGREPKTLIVGPGGQVRAIANTLKNWSAPEAVALFEALQEGRL